MAYLFLLALLALMWFLLIRPQRRRQTAQQQMINSLEVGKEVVTAGGLYGTVTSLDGDEVHVRIAPEVEVRIAKRAIAAVLSDDEELEELESADEPEEESAANLP